MHAFIIPFLIFFFSLSLAVPSEFIFEPREAPYRVTFPFKGYADFPKFTFTNTTNTPGKDHCMMVYNCPQSIRLDWMPSHKHNCPLKQRGYTTTRRAATEIDTQTPTRDNFVLTRFTGSQNKNVSFDRGDRKGWMGEDHSHVILSTIQCYLPEVEMYDRWVDVAVVYRNDIGCWQWEEDPCGDLTMVNVTLKLDWLSNFKVDAFGFELPDAMLDVLDVQYQFQFLLAPDPVHNDEIYVVLGLPNSFVDKEWEMLRQQWLNRTFSDVMRFRKWTQIRILDMQLGYHVPALAPAEKCAVCFEIGMALVFLGLGLVICGLAVWVCHRRRLSSRRKANSSPNCAGAERDGLLSGPSGDEISGVEIKNVCSG